MTKRWIAGLVAVPLALTLATGASAQEEAAPEKKEMEQDRIEVQLEPKNDSGLSGVAVISHAADQEDAKRIALHLEGADPGETYPAHIHNGTCAEPGSVVTALESPTQNMEGRATSETVVTRADFEAKAETETAEREKTMEEGEEYAEARAEAEMAEETGKAHSYVIQVHLPGGTPAACGALPAKEKEKDHGEDH